MTQIPLKDILISARQESHRMRHYYMGVEHLFIALLGIKGGLTSSLMEDYGLQPDYVVDAVRRKIGKGGRHRLWAGTPNTPRLEIILDIAHEIALSHERQTIHERDLLLGIIEENENIPMHVLRQLGLQTTKLKEQAETRTLNIDSQQLFVKIEFSTDFEREDALNKEHLFILRRMFHGYSSIRIERQLTGGYTPSLVLVVTPIHADNREDASVVVKIGYTDSIIDEAQRYERYVKSTLPPLTARLEEAPTAPESSDYAAIKYTLIRSADQQPHDLRSMVAEWDGEKLGHWLKDKLFETFGKSWWQQSRPYRFKVWQEYDWLLPPILTLEYVAELKDDQNYHTLKPPLRRPQLKQLEYGANIIVENFIVQKVNREQNSIQLAISQGNEVARAYKIEIRGIDFDNETYYRGEIVDRIIGRVWKTRREQLNHAARALEADFDISAPTIPYKAEKLPNPIIAYESLMDTYIDGSLSIIHGDLHLGNIMIGPNDEPLLIDFAHTRDGYTIFDWANLEMSLLSDLIMPIAGVGWEAAEQVLEYLISVNENKPLPEANPTLANSMNVIIQLRNVVQSCLQEPDDWQEYYVALGMCCLRAHTWQTMAINSRRLLFLVAALAFYEFNRHQQSHDFETQSPDTTDFISNS